MSRRNSNREINYDDDYVMLSDYVSDNILSSIKKRDKRYKNRKKMKDGIREDQSSTIKPSSTNLE